MISEARNTKYGVYSPYQQAFHQCVRQGLFTLCFS
jgi:hypothetical protein